MSETKATIGDVYRCAKCGGTNVEFEESNWYDPHTGENIGDGMRLDGEFCNDCQEDHGVEVEYNVELPPELVERIAAHERDERVRDAAHDLLSALKAFRDGWEGNLSDAMNQANALINEIEGRS